VSLTAPDTQPNLQIIPGQAGFVARGPDARAKNNHFPGTNPVPAFEGYRPFILPALPGLLQSFKQIIFSVNIESSEYYF
jgi:hypothetical protein